MFEISLPKTVLTEAQQAAKQCVCSHGLMVDFSLSDYITRCDAAMRQHLGIKQGKLALAMEASKIFSNVFSLSMGYEQSLHFDGLRLDIEPHLRLYIDEPIYLGFQVSLLPPEWHCLWGIAMARVQSALSETCDNSLHYLFYDEDLIIEAIKRPNRTLPRTEYDRFLQYYTDDIDDDNYKAFIAFIDDYRPFLTSLYLSDPAKDWAAVSTTLDNASVEQLDRILTAIENATTDLHQANVPTLIIDESRPTSNIYTLLLCSDEIEYDAIQNQWEIFNNDPAPAVIGLCPTPSSDLRAYLTAFMTRSQAIEALINFFSQLSE